MSKREEVISGVLDLVKQARPTSDVQRNRNKAQTVAAEGDIILRDGDPGDPTEETLSPLTYTYEHHMPLEVSVRANGDDSDTDLDSVLMDLGAAIFANRYLGGLCDWLEISAPQTDPVVVEGARAGRWADLEIVATYTTTNPLN